ncbi:hypothetical protein [Actinomadura roseirufa]|uniref:hypothetical protein n=1 Tax=Actinomadura roseirufa TaxID=2094049 RepID=UPI0010413F07|nr:hypothetical protein [Actinomadura roseirufa]
MNKLTTIAIGLAARIATTASNRADQMELDLRHHRDRGSGVVETVILVAGFAGLAFTIYVTVSGKVHSWINKIPGPHGP